MRKLVNILIVVLMLILLTGSVIAQDAEPGVIEIDSPEGITITQPGEGDGTVGGIAPYQFLVLVGLVIVVLIYTAYENHSQRKLHLEAVDRLYKSAPPIVREPGYSLISGVGDNVLAGIDLLADATLWTDLDNQAHERIALYWQEMKNRWQELRQDITAKAQNVSATEWTPENAIEYLQARNYQVVQQVGGNWQGAQGVFSPASESMQPDRASYLSDESDTDFLETPPKG